MDFLHFDVVLKLASLVVVVAGALITIVPDGTLLHKILLGIVTIGSALGIYSTTGRAPLTQPTVNLKLSGGGTGSAK